MATDNETCGCGRGFLRAEGRGECAYCAGGVETDEAKLDEMEAALAAGGTETFDTVSNPLPCGPAAARRWPRLTLRSVGSPGTDDEVAKLLAGLPEEEAGG